MSGKPVEEDVQSLYVQHHRWLQNWLKGRVGNPFDAADLAQDTFERLLKLGSLVGIENPRAYLCTVAGRLAINHRRRQEIEAACLETLSVLSAQCTITLEQQYLLQQTLCALDELLESLSPKVRQVFLLSKLEDMTYVQIAAEMGISERMVKKHMAQAMLQCLQAGIWEETQNIISHD